MTAADKLNMVKTIMGADAPDDAIITTYLDLAQAEILNWRYSFNPEEKPNEVPAEYEVTQVYAVVNGFTHRGLEGQLVSIENGIHRHFSYADMVAYIRSNVVAMAKVPGRVSDV